MKKMDQSLNFIKEFVTPVTKATYNTKTNTWYIGYAYTEGVYNGLSWSMEQAEEALTKQVSDIIKFLRHNFACLTDNQLTALTSLIHDIGTEAFISSDIPALIRVKKYIVAASSFMFFNIEGRSVSAKKAKRRKKEQQLFCEKVSHDNSRSNSNVKYS